MKYQVNDVELQVLDEGSKSPAILFLHFWGGSSRTWTEVAAQLKDRYRVIRYDQRGWGESDKPDKGYDVETLAADATALIGQLHLDDYILVGHSMGGKVAQYLAAQRPKGLRKLILVAPSPAAATILPSEIRESQLAAYTSEQGMNDTIDHVFLAGNVDKGIRARIIEDMKRHSEASRLGWPTISLVEDFSERLSRINVPTLILAGERDVVDTPARLEQETKEKIPGASMITIPDVGHLMMLQAPDTVAGYIDGFARE